VLTSVFYCNNNKSILFIYYLLFVFLLVSEPEWTHTKQTQSHTPTITSLSLNVGNFITLKLNQTNYLLWREQALALVESQELVEHLTNEDPTPIKYITQDPINNPHTENTVPVLIEAFLT